MNVLFTFLSNSSFLFLFFLFFFFFFWEGFECLLLQTITLICVTSFEVIIHSFPEKELCVVDGVFFTSVFHLHREGIKYYST